MHAWYVRAVKPPFQRLRPLPMAHASGALRCCLQRFGWVCLEPHGLTLVSPCCGFVNVAAGARADMNKHMNNHMQAHQRAMGAGMGTAGGAGGRGAAPQPGGPPVPGQSPFRGPFAGIANQMAGGTCITAVGLLGVALVNATAIV